MHCIANGGTEAAHYHERCIANGSTEVPRSHEWCIANGSTEVPRSHEWCIANGGTEVLPFALSVGARSAPKSKRAVRAWFDSAPAGAGATLTTVATGDMVDASLWRGGDAEVVGGGSWTAFH